MVDILVTPLTSTLSTEVTEAFQTQSTQPSDKLNIKQGKCILLFYSRLNCIADKNAEKTEAKLNHGDYF